MNFKQDGGLSQVRYHLHRDDSPLTQAALTALSSNALTSGRLVCQCGAVDNWYVRILKSRKCSYLTCGCNGSELPVYVGPPPDIARTEEWSTVLCPKCSASPYEISGSSFAVVIGIGYEGVVPKLGEIEVEMAKEIVVACKCNNCSAIHISWEVHLLNPFEVIGTEPWLTAIQGFHLEK